MLTEHLPSLTLCLYCTMDSGLCNEVLTRPSEPACKFNGKTSDCMLASIDSAVIHNRLLKTLVTVGSFPNPTHHKNCSKASTKYPPRASQKEYCSS